MVVQKFPLTRAYIVAFAILVMWSSFAYYTMHSMIDSQKQYAKLINLSGKQRMLSQKTALYASRYYNEQSDKLMVHLIELLEMMKKDHQYITDHITSKQIAQYYFGLGSLDKDVRNYFLVVQDFIDSPSIISLQLITEYSSTLLGKLDGAVSAFESESEQKVFELQRRELFIFVGTLLTLILEALLIFVPVHRFFKNYTEHLQSEVKSRTKELAIFHEIFKNSKEGMVITDKNGIIIDANDAFTIITGYDKEEALGKNPNFLQSGKHNKTYYSSMWDILESQGIWQGEITNRRKTGVLVTEMLTIIRLFDDESLETNYVGIFTDITERIKNEQKLQYLATHDVLTGLPNRVELLNHIDHALKISERIQKKIAIVFIDLDNFKVINDSIGHSMGDKYLITIATRLRNTLRNSDIIGRLGGDEFVILLESIDDEQSVLMLLEKIKNAIGEPVTLMDNDFITTASFGVVVYPHHNAENCDAKTLIRKADLAMYHAKSKGKNQVALYDETLNDKIQSQLLVETQLREAIQKDELELFFQPKIDLIDKKVCGAEALVRWKKDGTLIFPDRFIPIAEESSLIIDIDFWVCKEALRIQKEFHSIGLQNITLSLNISAKTLSNDAMMQKYLKCLKEETGTQHNLDIEITENNLVGNILEAENLIQSLKSLGLSVTLDDFGTGYSSFSYLSGLPFDSLKIDRSFIFDLESAKQQILIEAMISFSKKLGIRVVAEGIENRGHLEWLMSKSCDEVQGYYFAKPLDKHAFIDYVENFSFPL